MNIEEKILHDIEAAECWVVERTDPLRCGEDEHHDPAARWVMVSADMAYPTMSEAVLAAKMHYAAHANECAVRVRRIE